MARVVHVEAPVRLVRDQVLHAAAQQTEVDEALDDLANRRVVDRGQAATRPARLEPGLLRRQHQLVDRAAGAREAAADGIGASDVRGVAFELAARVDQDQLVVAQLLVVGDVVEDRGIATSADDGRVGGAARAAAAKGVLDHRLQLVLVDGAASEPGGGFVAFACDVCCAPHHVELGGLLEQAHLVDDPARIDDRLGGLVALAGAQPQALERLGDLRVHGRVASENVVEALRAAHEIREVLGERVVGVRLVGLVVAPRAVDPGPVPGPGLRVAVSGLDVEGVLGSAVGAQHGDGVGMIESRQVREIAVLTKRVVGVARAGDERGAQQDRDGSGSHGVTDSLAAFGEHAAILAQGRSPQTTVMPPQYVAQIRPSLSAAV